MAPSSQNNDLHSRDQKSILGTYARTNIQFVSGKGAILWDVEGREYLDFASGIAVNALGHCHPEVAETLRAAAESPLHLSNLYPSANQVDLAELLLAKVNFDKVFFCNSGTEANEAMLKFARKYWFAKGRADKHKVICFDQSFHGRTYGALSVTGQAKFKEGFGPMLPGAVTLPYNDAGALAEALDDDQIAAVILEPIQAEGGLNTPSKEFVRVLQEKRKNGNFLILGDEIQCALGRLGTALGGEVYELPYDMVSLAKPLGGGLPLGAVLLRNEQAIAVKAGDHGTTFGGNPVACALGKVVVKTVLQEEFLTAVHQKSQQLLSGIESLVEEFTDCVKVKGAGLLCGFQYKGELPQFLEKCKSKGLLILRAGTDVVRLAPPLVVEEAQIARCLEILKETLSELEVQ